MASITNIKLRFTPIEKGTKRPGDKPTFSLSHPLLTALRERQLFQIIRSGNEREANKALETLLACNQQGIYDIARKYIRHGIPLEELIQQGNIGLLMAAKDFDPGRGTRFMTYAFNWIRNEIVDLLRLYGKGSKVKRVFIPIEKISPKLAAADRSPEEAVTIERVKQNVIELPERLSVIINLRYGEGATYQAIGNTMGFSHTRAQQLETEALKLLRKNMGIRGAGLG